MDNKDITSILNSEEYFSDLKMNPHGVDGYKDCINQAFKITNNTLSLYGFNAEEVAGRYSLDLTVNGTKIKFNVKQGDEIDTENLIIGLNKVLEAVSYREGKTFVEVKLNDINYGIAFISDKKINALKNDGQPSVERPTFEPSVRAEEIKPVDLDTFEPTAKSEEIKPVDLETFEPTAKSEEIKPVDLETFEPTAKSEEIKPVDLETFEPTAKSEEIKPVDLVTEKITFEKNSELSKLTEEKEKFNPDEPLQKKDEIYTSFTEPTGQAKDKIEDVESSSVNDLLDQLMSESPKAPVPNNPPSAEQSPASGTIIKDFDVDKFMGFTPSKETAKQSSSNSRPLNPVHGSTPRPQPVINVSEDKLNEMRQYSDYRLLNTVKQSNNYSNLDVEAAKIVLNERGIQQKETSSKMGKLPQYIKYAEMQLKRGVGPANILRDLKQRGMPDDLAKEALAKASINLKNSRSTSSGGSSGMSVWGWIIAIIVIIRILALIARG